MNVKVYSLMREWENNRSWILENVEKLNDLKAGEGVVADPFSIHMLNADQTKEELERRIAYHQENNSLIADDLFNKMRIDVEYVVTNTYPHLKYRYQLHNYFIVQEKVEQKAQYEYIIYEGVVDSKTARKSFSSLREAVEEINSYYEYLSKKESAEVVLNRFYNLYGQYEYFEMCHHENTEKIDIGGTDESITVCHNCGKEL